MLSLRNGPQIIRTPRHSFKWAAELLWSLSAHRIGLRYKETLFGFGWIFLQPVALTVIFNYIQRIAQISSGSVPYPLFSATGLVAWGLTALVVSQSTTCITGYAVILKRVALPRILLPMSLVIAVLADFCVMAVMLIGLFLYYSFSIHWTALWIFPLLSLHLTFLFGLACLVSLATIFLRDIGHATSSLIQLWFFASPVFYPSSMVPEKFRALAQWNPMSGFIESYRSVLLLGTLPPMNLLGPTLLVTAFTFLIGVICFSKLRGVITDAL